MQHPGKAGVESLHVGAVAVSITAPEVEGVTLEPGDIISTGTPAGVGNTTGTYLKPGNEMIAAIDSIGELHSSVISEK